jgi:ribosomal protein L7/L12
MPTYSVTLLSPGHDRLQLMAALRELRPDLGPQAAKALVDNPPQVILPEVSHPELERVKRRLARTGAAFEYRIVGHD